MHLLFGANGELPFRIDYLIANLIRDIMGGLRPAVPDLTPLVFCYQQFRDSKYWMVSSYTRRNMCVNISMYKILLIH